MRSSSLMCVYQPPPNQSWTMKLWNHHAALHAFFKCWCVFVVVLIPIEIRYNSIHNSMEIPAFVLVKNRDILPFLGLVKEEAFYLDDHLNILVMSATQFHNWCGLAWVLKLQLSMDPVQYRTDHK